MTSKKGVLLSSFDKAFVDVVKFLSDNWMRHKKFRHRKDLLKKLDINHTNWSSINAGGRNVPKRKQAKIRETLINDFGIRPGYLDTYRGSMFTEEPSWVSDVEIGYLTKDNRIAQLEREMQELKKELRQAKEKIKLQEELLEALRSKSKPKRVRQTMG